MNKAAFFALHYPEAPSTGEMVYSVWEDGEITLEKGGDLFGRRTLHCISMGNPAKAWQAVEFPVLNPGNGGHGRIYVRDHETAVTAANMILKG
jgi:hypothetical protein